MDRIMVYPGGIPLDTDMLATNRNIMIALGYLAQMVLGSNPVVDGLACSPTAPQSMSVTVSAGSLTQMSVVDVAPYGSLPAATTDPLLKMGINVGPAQFTLLAPTAPGQTIAYLIEGTLQELDASPVVLPYYNAANPAQPYSGPSNSGQPQATRRMQQVQLQLKSGIPAVSGLQVAPATDTGWVPLYVITVSYGQTTIDQSSIVSAFNSPALLWKLPMLRPGFGTGVQSFNSSGTFVVPAGATQVEVELWGGGSGTFGSSAGAPSGGGSGGGYAKKRVANLTPGQQIAVTVGIGGGASPTAGGTSNFGSFVSATGGSLNYLATVVSPQNGATPPGVGVGGDVNLSGSAGQAGSGNQGGMGGAGPMGGTQNSGTTGINGLFPGGGASGAGTGANGSTPYAGAAGAGGLIVVRW
jgi:hypothetical protein